MAIGRCPVNNAHCNFVPPFERLEVTDRPQFEKCSPDGELNLLQRCGYYAVFKTDLEEFLTTSAQQQTEGEA